SLSSTGNKPVDLVMSPPTRTTTLFPYTTLFRSSIEPRIPVTVTVSRSVADWGASCACALKARQLTMAAESRVLRCMLSLLNILRSEEHTSELQSRENLVCRLLLEKKKNMCDR